MGLRECIVLHICLHAISFKDFETRAHCTREFLSKSPVVMFTSSGTPMNFCAEVEDMSVVMVGKGGETLRKSCAREQN